MATSRIPGPFRPETDTSAGEGDGSWPHFGRNRHRYHVPGPVGSYHEGSWKRAHFVAPAYREDVEAYFKVLTKWEGLVLYMYLDTKGYVTVGIGNLLKTLTAAQALPFLNTSAGEPATEQEIEAAYNAVSRMEAAKKPRSYKLSPSIEITDDYARGLARERLRSEFLPGIRRVFPDFDSYPPSARDFMVDMAYNGGPGYFAMRHMNDLIKRQKWLDVVGRVPTQGNPDRRAWREALLRRAAMGM